MATQAQYASIPKIGMTQISTANTARDGTGTITEVFLAGTNGSRIDAIKISATGTTTAGMIRLYISNGTNIRLYAEIPVIPVTPSGVIPSFSADIMLGANNIIPIILPIILPVNHSLRASTQNAETFNILAFGGDF